MSNYRRRSIVVPLLLVALGVLFLYTNLRPEVNPWPLVSRWWPLLLIFLGLGKLWDFYRLRSQSGTVESTWLTGGEIAVIVLLVLLVSVALSRKGGTPQEVHQVESVERQGAESVRIQIEMGAGQLKIAGGANKLLEADFRYSEAEGKPKIAYDVSGKQGRLTISQSGTGIHLGRTHNDWNMRLANDMPMELKIEMGAGQGDLRLGGLLLTKLDVEMGAGQATVDLTGDWKKDLDAKIEGGVGTATIRLPKNVGVRVHAAGGIGSISVRGLGREGDAYVNHAYGKSPVTLRLNIEGGVGTINLEGS
jgi:hypothetical protein